MKKLLLIIIIAVITCIEVEEKVQKENELEVNHHDFLDSIDFEDPNIVELDQSLDSIKDKLTELIKSGNIQGKDIFEKVKDVIEKGKDILKDFDGIETAPDSLKQLEKWDKIVSLIVYRNTGIAITHCYTVIKTTNCIPLVHIMNEVISKYLF